MPNSKLSTISRVTTTAGSALAYIVQDPDGTPASKAIAISSLFLGHLNATIPTATISATTDKLVIVSDPGGTPALKNIVAKDFMPLAWQASYGAIVVSQDGWNADGASVIGANARGIGAVDLQLRRAGTNDIASGNYAALIGGKNALASGLCAGSFVGSGNQVSGENAAALGGGIAEVTGFGAVSLGGEGLQAAGVYAACVGGRDNTSSGYAAVTMGTKAKAMLDCMFAHGTHSATGGYGDLQYGRIVLGGRTEGATTTTLVSGHFGDVVPVLPADYVIHFRGIIIGAEESTPANYAIYKVEDGIIHGFEIETPTITEVANTAGVASTPTITIDGQDGQELTVTVTGAANKNIRWFAYLHLAMVYTVIPD